MSSLPRRLISSALLIGLVLATLFWVPLWAYAVVITAFIAVALSEFFAMAQEKYQVLMQAGATSPVALLTALHGAMAAHPVLAKVSMNR